MTYTMFIGVAFLATLWLLSIKVAARMAYRQGWEDSKASTAEWQDAAQMIGDLSETLSQTFAASAAEHVQVRDLSKKESDNV